MGAAGTFMYYISVFISSQMPAVVEPDFGLSGMFLVFAAITGIFLGVVLVFVPETKGKTYGEHLIAGTNTHQIQSRNRDGYKEEAICQKSADFCRIHNIAMENEAESRIV